MKRGSAGIFSSNAGCNGEIRIGDGVLSVDCRKCKMGMDLSEEVCFNGISGRILPGFRGSVVLEGVEHRSYDGAMVEALTSHSHILADIRDLARGPEGPRKSLMRISRRMEEDFLGDPLSLERSRADYEKAIRRAMRSRKPPELDRLHSMIEAVSVMMKKLERDASRSG
ncbi:MAG: hypothetical protein ACMUHM_05770 [Thermoplasmatota archaeon]